MTLGARGRYSFGPIIEYSSGEIHIRGATPKLTTETAKDLILLPGAGGITQIGDAGATSHGLVNNDDLFVSGKLEVDGNVEFDGSVTFGNTLFFYSYLHLRSVNGMGLFIFHLNEEVTIPIGQGAGGIVTAGNLAPLNSTIIGVVFRVIQAPGGGATTLDIGRTGGGNLDEFIDGASCDVLGETGTFAANHDAATTGPVLNAADDTLTLTTDVNVAGSDMKVRIVVFYRQEIPPAS